MGTPYNTAEISQTRFRSFTIMLVSNIPFLLSILSTATIVSANCLCGYTPGLTESLCMANCAAFFGTATAQCALTVSEAQAIFCVDNDEIGCEPSKMWIPGNITRPRRRASPCTWHRGRGRR